MEGWFLIHEIVWLNRIWNNAEANSSREYYQKVRKIIKLINSSISHLRNHLACKLQAISSVFCARWHSLSLFIAGSLERLSDNEPSFSQPITNITAPLGRDAILSCHVENLETFKVGWMRVSALDGITSLIFCAYNCDLCCETGRRSNSSGLADASGDSKL